MEIVIGENRQSIDNNSDGYLEPVNRQSDSNPQPMGSAPVAVHVE